MIKNGGFVRNIVFGLGAIVLGWLVLVAFPYDPYSRLIWVEIAFFFLSALAIGVLFGWLSPGRARRFLFVATLPSAVEVYRSGTESDQTMWPVALVIPVTWFLVALIGVRLNGLRTSEPTTN